MKFIRSIQAVLYSTAIFMLLHYLLQVSSNYIATHSTSFLNWIVVPNIAAYSLYLLCGFIAGTISKNCKFCVGFIAGLLASFTAIQIFGVGFGGNEIDYLIVIGWGSILGGIGGALSQLVIPHVKKSIE